MLENVKNAANKTKGFLKKYGNKIVLITAIVLAILYLNQCGNIKYERKKAKQNQEALTKEVETVKLKNGELMTQRATLLASKKELENLNSELKEEYDILRKEKSKPKVIIKTKIVYRDTGSVKNTVAKLDSNKYSLKFVYVSSDGIIGVNGRSEFFATPKLLDGTKNRFKLDVLPGTTFFDTISVKMGLTLGVKEDRDGIDRVFAKPNSNKIQITDINAVQLEEYYKSKYNNHKDKKKGRLSLGIYGGYGLNVGSNNIVRMGPSFGFGLNYRIIKIPFF